MTCMQALNVVWLDLEAVNVKSNSVSNKELYSKDILPSLLWVCKFLCKDSKTPYTLLRPSQNLARWRRKRAKFMVSLGNDTWSWTPLWTNQTRWACFDWIDKEHAFDTWDRKDDFVDFSRYRLRKNRTSGGTFLEMYPFTVLTHAQNHWKTMILVFPGVVGRAPS